MKLFGITLEIKKEPKWVSFETFLDLSRLVQDIADGVDTNRKAIEANRKRIERKLPDNGEIDAQAKAAIENIVNEDKPPASGVPRTGDPI